MKYLRIQTCPKYEEKRPKQVKRVIFHKPTVAKGRLTYCTT